MKHLLLVLITLSMVTHGYAQINRYDRQSQATYTPRSFQDMAAVAMMMRQKADANADYAEQIMEWILGLKKQVSEQYMLSRLTTLYNTTKNIYLNGDLARAGNSLKTIALTVQEEISNYNERIEQATYASTQEYSSKIYNISVITPCEMTLVHQTATRNSYGCSVTGRNMRIAVDPAESGLTIQDISKAYDDYAKTPNSTFMINKEIIPFKNIEAFQYDQLDGRTTIRHLNFIYKGHVYNVMFAMLSGATDYNTHYKTFINSINFQ